MAYDVELDELLAGYAVPLGAVRKPMFGGTGYMLNGNMLVGVWKDGLVLRLGPEGGAGALTRPGVLPFSPTPGRPMAGWVMIPAEALASDDIAEWVAQAFAFVSTLPPK